MTYDPVSPSAPAPRRAQSGGFSSYSTCENRVVQSIKKAMDFEPLMVSTFGAHARLVGGKLAITAQGGTERALGV